MEKKSKKSKNRSFGAIWIVIAIILIVIVVVAVKKSRDNESISATTNPDNQNTMGNSYVQEIEDGVKLNTSSKMNEAKEAGGFKFNNIQLTTKDRITTLLMDVTNISGTATELKNVEITLLDQSGNELTTVKGVITALENNASTQLNIATTSDYIEAYDFRISVK